jgi:Glucose-6-phosphate dehydrogenase, C-terminal domain
MNESKTEVRLQFKSQAGFFGEHAEGFRNEFIIQLKPTNSMYMKMNIKKPGLEMDAITAELNLSYDDRCILHAISLPAHACTHCCSIPVHWELHSCYASSIDTMQPHSPYQASVEVTLIAPCSLAILLCIVGFCFPQFTFCAHLRFAACCRFDDWVPEAYERLILDAMNGNQQHFVRRDELRASWAIFTPMLHKLDAGKGPKLQKYDYGARGVDAGDQLLADSGYVRSAKYSWKSHAQEEREAKSRL